MNAKRTLLWLALVVVASAFAAYGDVPAMQLDAAYDAETRDLSGTLFCPVPANGRAAYFLLLPNLDRDPNPFLGPRQMDARYPRGFESSSLDVLEVTLVSGETRTTVEPRWLALPPTLQTYSLAGTAVAIGPVQTDSRAEIRFITHTPVTSLGDGSVTEDALTWRFGWYPLLLEEDGSLVEKDGTLTDANGGFPLVFPRATIDAKLTLPAEARFATGADVVEVLDASSASEVTTYAVTYAAPTRSFALFLAPDRDRYVLDGDVPIEVIYNKGHESIARFLATIGRDVLNDFAARYGAYPRSRLTIVESPHRDGSAYAADGILFLSSRYWTHRDVPVSGLLDRLTEFVVAHEIAHMWFGLRASVDLDRDAWLSEGLSQAAAVAYIERRFGAFGPNLFEIGGHGVAEDAVRRQFGYFNLREHLVEFPYISAVWEGFDEAVVKPMAEVRYANENATRLYDKGYVVARALAAYVGDDAFERAMRRSLAEGEGQRLDVERLRVYLEEESGQSLAEWFSAWLTGDATVDYAVAIESRGRAGETHETVVRVTRDGGTPQNVEIEAVLTSGATTRQTWDGAGGETTLVFRTPSAVARVTVDPEHRLPDRERLNNHSPVKVVRATVGAAFPLDAYVLSTNAATGEVSLGLLDRFQVTLGDNRAALAVRTGRDGLLRSDVALVAGSLVGGISFTHTTFAQPPTGSAAEAWEPDLALSVGAMRLVSDGEPVTLLRLALSDLPTLASSSQAAIGFDLVSTGAWRIAASAFGEARLWPGGYAQASGTLGYALGDLPTALRFRFSDLKAVRIAPAAVRASGSLALEVTTASGEPYNVLNLAMIDAARSALFVRGGVGWTTPGQSGTTSAGLEVGIEQIVDLSTLGGLLSLTVRAGIATPLLGEGKTAVYVDVSL
ncbi:MAG: M1 family aminopeptidase [Candidatus Bipolaricaulota bacterium]